MAAGASCLVPLALLMVRVISENTPSVSEQSVFPKKNLTGVKNDAPKFGEPIANITVAVGREAILTCLVEDLGAYKVAWLRVDTQTILTIHGHVITKNHRIGVTHSDHRNWYLHIKDVRQSDRGWYMCQINTDPMKSQVGFLDIVVPPDILDYGTSTDIVVREGSNVTFNCAASGSPAPNITWRREGGESISVPNGQEVTSVEGSQLSLTKISRLHMGAYLCIASNGVPPSVSKRIMLLVHFPPMIWIQNQLVGSMEGEKMTLECHSEAFPKSINYWTRESGELISQGPKFEAANLENSYKVHMKLTIQSVSATDYGSYKCVSKNSLGDTDGTIKLYHIPTPTTTIATTVTTEEITTTTKVVPKVKPEKKRPKERKKQQQHQAVNQVNDIAHAPEVRDEIQIAQTDRVKVEENRSETKMDRSHFPASGASSQMRRLKTGGSLLYHFLWISAAPSALSLLISNFHLVGVRQQVL